MEILKKFEGSWKGKSVDTTLTNFNDICIKHDIIKIYKIEAINTAPNTYTILLNENGIEYFSIGSVLNGILYSTDGDKFVFVDGILYQNYQKVTEFESVNGNVILEPLIS
jgi:hypothetical protein